MQKTAILGWGSLIWDPRNLNYDEEVGWNDNGPMLPIEFARISNDGRLTLVITENGSEVKTYFSVSKYDSLDEAILNLAVREGCGRKNVGYYDKTKNEFSENFKFKINVLNWIKNTDFDAVIWTNLGENWTLKSKDRIQYLKELKDNTSALAEEYIRKTPIQINTDYRKRIEEELNWKPIY